MKALSQSAILLLCSLFLTNGRSDIERPLASHLVPFGENGQFGYLDVQTGEWSIQPRFDAAQDFSDGLAAVLSEGRWGYIDEKGNFAIKSQFILAGPFSEGIAFAAFGTNSCAYINKSGEVIAETEFNDWFSSTRRSSFSEGRGMISIKGKLGYIDAKGRKVIEPRYTHAKRFSGGLAAVILDGKCSFINKTGQLQDEIKTEGWSFGDTRTGEFSEGLVVGASTIPPGLFGYLSTNGEVVMKAQFMEAGRFSEGLARVQAVERVKIERLNMDGERAGPVGYIDRNGRYVIEPQFEVGGDFSDGLAAVSLKGRWGYIDKSGKMVIEPQFAKAAPFSRGLALVYVNDQPQTTNRFENLNRALKLACIDRRGGVLWGPKAPKDDRSPDERMTDAYVRIAIAHLRDQSETNRFATQESFKNLPRSAVSSLKRYANSEDAELRTIVRRAIAHLSSEAKAVEEGLQLQVQQWGGHVTPNTNGGFDVDLYTAKVTDITPLKGFPIKSLDLRSTGVRDFSPLQGTPLEKLVLDGVTNLASLRGLPLKILHLRSARELTDLSPLAGMPLHELFIEQCLVRDLSPLQELPLKSLSLFIVPFADLSPLRNLQLTNLLLLHCNVTNLDLVRGMPLQRLDLFADIRVSGRERARKDITDLSPLTSLPLTDLFIGGYAITNLSPLAGSQISTLGISGTLVIDLSPLRKLPLRRLKMRDVPVTDLSPLKGMKLEELDLIGSDVKDASPLEDVEISTLFFSPETVTGGLDQLRRNQTIKHIGNGRSILPSKEFWEKYDGGQHNPRSR